MPDFRRGNLSAFDISGKVWKDSSGGKILKTKRRGDGTEVFIKQYTNIKEPILDSSTSNAIYAKRMEKFERQVQNRGKINQLMREETGKGGNIIIPYDEFVCDHLYTEVAEFIPGLMRPEEILALSDPEKLQFIKTAINALGVVHSKRVIHIDIKPDNVIAVRNSYGLAVGKIIDFDSSLLAKLPIPDDIGGDKIYQSPELAEFRDSEGDPELAKTISEKTDIYSLGVTMHYYLTGGKLPGYTDVTEPEMKKWIEKKIATGKDVYPWEASLGNGTLVMDPSLPKLIADIIAEMTVREPEKRPTCDEVFAMLSSGGDKIDPPKPSDAIEWNVEKMRADGYTGIHYNSAKRQYELTKYSVVKERLDVRGLIEKGYASSVTDNFEEIPELILDKSRLNAMRYTGLHVLPGGKYSLTQNRRSLMECDAAYLIAHKFAKPKSGGSVVPPPPSRPGPTARGGSLWDDPNPSDGIKSWDKEKIEQKGYNGIKSLGGGNYALLRDGNPTGKYAANRLIQLKYAIAGSKEKEEEYRDVFEAPNPADGITAWDEEKLRKSGYTGIQRIGDGKYILIRNGHKTGEYEAARLIRLRYARN